MKIVRTTAGYFKWHYGKAMLSVFDFWENMLFFLYNYFSIKDLAANFFSPWKRISDRYPKEFSFSTYSQTFAANMMMRIVGILFRSTLLSIGLSACVIFVVLLPLSFIIWLLLPLFDIWLFLYGVILIIFS